MTLDRQIITNTAATELVNLLLESSTVDYPWNPADPDTANYYTDSDSYFSLDDWSDTEIQERSNSFFASIQSCWADTPDPEAEETPQDLTATLTQQFAARVPQQWLNTIANKVSNLASSNLEPAEKLVQSVQDLLSNWSIDDLLVLARPYAYAMRCDTGVENPDNIVRPVAWDALSDLEKAKFTILVAQYAIDCNEQLTINN
jgi:hypothetical protein